jgi:hypothetical protein
MRLVTWIEMLLPAVVVTTAPAEPPQGCAVRISAQRAVAESDVRAVRSPGSVPGPLVAAPLLDRRRRALAGHGWQPRVDCFRASCRSLLDASGRKGTPRRWLSHASGPKRHHPGRSNQVADSSNE